MSYERTSPGIFFGIFAALHALFAALIFGRIFDHRLSIDAETMVRTSTVPVLRLPSWASFRAFIERARSHREHVGDGFYPEAMRSTS